MWERLDVLNVLLFGVHSRNSEGWIWGERVFLIGENILVEVVVEEGGDESSILIICDSASVVTFSRQILQSSKGYFGPLIQEHFELSNRDSQIRLIELVPDVPPERAILPSFLDDSMEECQGVNQSLKVRWLYDIPFEELLVGDGVSQVRTCQIGLQSFWGLVGHLHSVLENSCGEFIRGVRGQPQSKFRVKNCWVRVELLAYFLKDWHPGYCQMTVL